MRSRLILGPVEWVPISEVAAPARLLRVYTRRHQRQFARSLEAFGHVAPIIVDGSGEVVAGLVWFFAAKELELPDIPVIRVRHLSPEQVAAYRIAEQRLTEIAPWDDAALASTFKDLSTLDLDFSLESTGFSMAEIDLRIDA